MLLLRCRLIWFHGPTLIGLIRQSHKFPLTVTTVIKVDCLLNRVPIDGAKLILFIIQVAQLKEILQLLRVILIDQLPLGVLYHHFEVLILLLGLLLLTHWLLLNHLVFASSSTSLPLSDVEVITVFLLPIVDEAAITANVAARVVRAEEGVLDGSTP
jgi:hypothetical protein